MKVTSLIVVVVLVLSSNTILSYKILGFFPYKSFSHASTFLPLMEELARRGHQVSVVSHVPSSTLLANCTHINISSTFRREAIYKNIEDFDGNTPTVYRSQYLIYSLISRYEDILKLPQITNLLKEEFDVIIIQTFNTEVFFGFAYLLNAPIIGFASNDLFPWQNYKLGGPIEPSYLPITLSNIEVPMDFSERLKNTFETWFSIIVHHLFVLPKVQKLAEKYFGSLPNLKQITSNFSLQLVNTHFSIHGAKPKGPNVIEVGGIHLVPAKPLSQDLQKIMDNSTHGVIYFSLGSTISSTELRDDKKNAFLKVFSRINQTVLWKIQSNFSIPIPKNVIISSWYPQRDLLEHPNVVLFISQCGILSVIEAMNAGKPMICIPLLGDQHYNGKSLEFIKVGQMLDFSKITEENVQKAVHEILTNTLYKENAIQISKVFKDRPMSPMDTAVYWVEYVVRHKGAVQIKSLAKDLSWYQYHNIDVTAAMIVIVYAIYFSLKWLIAICIKRYIVYKDKIKTS